MRRFTQSQAMFLEATFVLHLSWLAFWFSSDSESYEMDAPYGFRSGGGFANRTPASPPAIGSCVLDLTRSLRKYVRPLEIEQRLSFEIEQRLTKTIEQGLMKQIERMLNGLMRG